MNKELINKFSLGTAQLGMDYGIANKNGKIKKNDAFEILNYAYKIGVDAIDTAHSYGDSEAVIGEFVKKNNLKFKIISKYPSVKSNAQKNKALFHESFKRLNTQSLYGYLVHSFEDFLKNKWLWEELEKLKAEGLVEKIGFSIYKPAEIEVLYKKNIKFDIIQFPYSVFDKRFNPYLADLKQRNIEIHVRSVFLQGLAFMQEELLPENLFKARDYIKKLNKISMKSNISISALCQNFVLTNSLIDRVVIGVDNIEHFKKNIENVNLCAEVDSLHDELSTLEICDEDILIPYNWSRK